MNIMKIALLNLPVDSNYGGMLQRYALVKVLQDMGHDVVHINMRFPINAGTPMQKLIRSLKRIIRRFQGKYDGAIRAENWTKQQYDKKCKITDQFYNKYIKHTKYIDNKAQLAKLCRKADVLLIGSDQVWRKEYVQHYGIGTYFGDFLPKSSSVKRIVYGASFGVADDMLSLNDKEYLKPLYESFSSVSVREDSALQLLNDYGWNFPQAEQVLDPTFLLFKEDYSKLIDTADTKPLDGNMLCYILDQTNEKEKVVLELAERNNMKPFHLSIDGRISVEQWPRSFRDADYIVTDSYHGLVFSIIMQKPVYLFMNKKRGNARFVSVLRLCGIENNGDCYDGNIIIRDFSNHYKHSFDYLRNSLSVKK